MPNTGNCPYCKKPVRNVKVEDVDIHIGVRPRWRGFSYLCPSCNCVLSVQMNLLVLNDDLVTSIGKSARQ